MGPYNGQLIMFIWGSRANDSLWALRSRWRERVGKKEERKRTIVWNNIGLSSCLYHSVPSGQDIWFEQKIWKKIEGAEKSRSDKID